MVQYPLSGLPIGTVIAFALASLYFWLLHRTQGSGLFWAVLVAGIFIGLV